MASSSKVGVVPSVELSIACSGGQFPETPFHSRYRKNYTSTRVDLTHLEPTYRSRLELSKWHVIGWR